MNTCPKCGASNSMDAISCGNCSTSLRNHEEAAPKRAPLNPEEPPNSGPVDRIEPINQQPEEKRSFDFSVITSHLIPILIGLAILIGAGWYFLFPSPARVAVKYIEASGKGDAKTALSLMTTQSQELIPANDLSTTQTLMPKMADKIEAKVTETKITGDTATCTLSISLPGQDSSNNQVAGMTQTVPLRKEGGKWKIDFRQTMVDIFRAMNQFKPGSLSTVKAQIAAKVGNDQKLLNAWNSVLQEASSQ